MKKSALIFLLVVFICCFFIVLPSCGEDSGNDATTEATAEETSATTVEETTTEPTTERTTQPPEVLEEVLRITPSADDLGFKAGSQIENLRFEDGVLKLTTTGGDPYIFTLNADMGLVAEDVDYIKIKIKNYASGYQNQLFFITNEDAAWSEEKSFRNEYWNSDGEDWEILELVTSDSELWAGTIKQLRFDVLNEEGDIDIEYISFEKIVG